MAGDKEKYRFMSLVVGVRTYSLYLDQTRPTTVQRHFKGHFCLI